MRSLLVGFALISLAFSTSRAEMSFAEVPFTVEEWQNGFFATEFDELAFVKDWNLTEEVDPILNVQSCRAWTSVVKTDGFQAQLSLSFAKDSSLYPIVTMALPAQAQKSAFAFLKLSSTETQPFLLLKPATDPNGQDIYWLPPLSYPKVMNLIADATTLEVLVFAAGIKTPIKISLTGSSATLKSVLACTQAKELSSEEFAKALNLKTPFDGQLPPDVSPTKLYQTVQEAFTSYRDGRRAATALAGVQKTMKPLLEEETKAKATLDSAQGKLDKTQGSLAIQRAEKADLEKKINALTGEQTSLTNEKVIADQDLASKTAVYEPVFKQIEPLMKSVKANQTRVDSLSEEIVSQQQTIKNSKARIEKWRTEAQRILADLPSLKRDVNEKESVLRQAESRLASYHVDYEYRRILDADWNYNHLKRQIWTLESDLRRAEMDENRARNDVSRARNDLQRCQASSTEPGGPNCGREISELNRAEMDLNRIRREADRARQDLQSTRSRMRWIEMDAEREVYRQRDNLVRERNAALIDLNNARSLVDSSEARYNEIIQVSIPRAETAIANAQNALPKLELELQSAKSDLAAAQSSLEATKNKLDFKRIEAQYLAAQERVLKISLRLSEIPKELKSQQSALDKVLLVITKLEKTESSQIKDRDVASLKWNEINQKLAPLRSEAAIHQAQTDRAKAAVISLRALYQALYDRLVSGI